MRSWIAIASLALGLTVSVGCGEVEEEFDCADICDEFNDCLVNFNVDETSCQDMCEDNNTPEEVDTCDDCIEAGGAACGRCTVECEGVFFPVSD